jgi:hypothetical protein
MEDLSAPTADIPSHHKLGVVSERSGTHRKSRYIDRGTVPTTRILWNREIARDSSYISIALYHHGSCSRDPDQRASIRSSLLDSQFDFTIVERAVQLLDWLREDPSEFAYGPYGLGLIWRSIKSIFARRKSIIGAGALKSKIFLCLLYSSYTTK